MPSTTDGSALELLQQGDLDGVRLLRDVAAVFTEPDIATSLERTLLELPSFAALYRHRLAASQPGPTEGLHAQADSLAAVLDDFQAFYGLVPDFFPVALAPNARPLEFAAWLLARDHDLYHVLCEYETSDHDEIALHSFLCGQAPCVFGCFVTTLMRAPRLSLGRFKHLRDLLDAELDREALARGQRARPLVTCDFSALAAQPITELRCALAIEPRGTRRSAHELRNTCGGRRAEPYFARSCHRPHMLA